jgi:glycosyltransferase involved in cell wall biosynthesis
VDILVPAFKQANVSGSRLVIAGPDEGVLEQIRPSLDESVVVTGYLDSGERMAALAAADVFALPATGEGLSMAVLEAMAAGLPPILTPGCNLPEAAEAGAGILVEPEIESLANALRDLLANPSLSREMGERARALVRERFTWQRVAEQIEGVYQRTLL